MLMNKALKEAFRRLADRLSPENLHRDGEATASEALRDERQCRKEWKALELLAGRKVSEEEAWKL